MNLLNKAAMFALLLFVRSRAARCSDRRNVARGSALTFTLENDVFTGSDNNYTNGLGVVGIGLTSTLTTTIVSSASGAASGRSCRSSGMRATPRTLRWTLAQEMNTPDDIRTRIRRGRPAVRRHPLCRQSCSMRKKERWAHVWELKLGVVGPASQAEQRAEGLPRCSSGANEPMGWDTQLPNEPVINVGYTVASSGGAGHVGDQRSGESFPSERSASARTSPAPGSASTEK